MRPVELQNSIMQAPNATASTQQQVARPEVAQQSFQQQLERTATLRPTQVQAPEAGTGAEAATITPDEHGEQRRRRPAKRAATRPSAGAPAEAAPATPAPPGSSKIDIVI